MTHINGVARLLGAGVILLIGSIALNGKAGADYWGSDVEKEIASRHQEFEAMLNTQNDPEALMSFLHETISHSAKITMKVHDPAAPVNEAVAHKLNKADYINSYLYGPRQIDDYHADLKTVNIQIDSDTKTVQSEEILTETGRTRVQNGYETEPQDFTSRTSCESIHGMDDNDQLVLMYSKCETDIMVDQAI